MALTKKTNRLDIYIEEGRQVILIRQKWKYQWLTATKSSWTLQQKRSFHHAVDGIIWKTWNYHYKVKVNGSSDFAKKYKNTFFTINFDIQWVSGSEHWKVNATKILGKSPISYVDWTNRVISLDTKDSDSTYKGSANGKNYYQLPAAHEFGHAIGNSYWALKGSTSVHGDEYNADNRVNGGFSLDYASIMHSGNELRNRHIDYILKELNTMLPNTIFHL
jgi:hypothetical protein